MSFFGWASVILGAIAWIAAFTQAGTDATYVIVFASLGSGIIHFFLSRSGNVPRHYLAWIGLALSGGLLLVSIMFGFLWG